jgi:hypothetical protein
MREGIDPGYGPLVRKVVALYFGGASQKDGRTIRELLGFRERLEKTEQSREATVKRVLEKLKTHSTLPMGSAKDKLYHSPFNETYSPPPGLWEDLDARYPELELLPKES